MSGRFGSVFSTTIVANLAAGPAETILCTTPPLTLSYDGQVVLLVWTLRMLNGVTGPTVVYNIRRGALLTSPLVTNGAGGCVEVGSVAIQRGGGFVDVNSGSGTPVYSLTGNVSNASSLSTLNEVCLAAFAL